MITPKQLVHHFQSDSLFQNSVYLMLSTAVQAVLGFGFWLLCARLFTPEEIGVGSTLISASTFIAYLSLLGFNSTFIRFLPTSTQRNDKLNTGLFLVLAGGTIVSVAYVLLLPYLAPKLGFVGHNAVLAGAFVLMSAAGAVNLLTDSIFVAYRAAKYNFIIYSIQALTKLALPLALVVVGAFGVFAASGLAAAVALVLSLFFVIKRFNYRPRLHLNRDVVSQVWQFSFTNYVANIFNIIPTVVVPLIVLNQLGAAAAGYFYLAFMLANLVYAIAHAVSESLFAEGSYGEVAFRRLLKKATQILGAIIIPVSAGMAVLGPVALGIFGKAYGTEAAQAIIVLALAAPAVAAYNLGCVMLRITKQIAGLVTVNMFYAGLICGLAMLWASKGLAWVAAAWLVGHAATALLSFGLVWFKRMLQARVAA